MKIAFHPIGSKNWIGGSSYLKNLILALEGLQSDELDMFFLAPIGKYGRTNDKGNNIECSTQFGVDGTVYYRLPKRPSLTWVINGVSKRIFSCDAVMQKDLKRRGIDVIFGQCIGYQLRRIATLSLLPDFQHRHLIHMFSSEEIENRDRWFLESLKYSTRIIVFSEAVKRDIQTFAQKYSSKTRVLRPVSYIPPSIYDASLDEVLGLYSLPRKFFYLPNQFWKHKNHATVFKAMKILKDKGINTYLVCTGNPVDYRHPEYISELLCQISQWGLREHVICLGEIPYEHVLLLIRQCICVLNPSLFEGWGSTVDEARSVGKRVLISDIPAHREQSLVEAVYFQSDSTEDLLNKMKLIWEETQAGPDNRLESEAIMTLPYRLKEFGEFFIKTAREAISEVI